MSCLNNVLWKMHLLKDYRHKGRAHIFNTSILISIWKNRAIGGHLCNCLSHRASFITSLGTDGTWGNFLCRIRQFNYISWNIPILKIFFRMVCIILVSELSVQGFICLLLYSSLRK